MRVDPVRGLLVVFCVALLVSIGGWTVSNAFTSTDIQLQTDTPSSSNAIHWDDESNDENSDESSDETDDEMDDETDDETDDEMDDEGDDEGSDCVVPALFGVQDTNLADSTLVRIDLLGSFGMTLAACGDCDIEALAINGDTGLLYGISGGDGSGPLPSGSFFMIDKETLELTAVRDTGTGRFGMEIVSASWRAEDGIWAFQQNVGLLRLDEGSGTTSLFHRVPRGNWEGLAWDPTGTYLYGSEGSNLFRFDPALVDTPENPISLVCSNLAPGGEVEALEFDSNGTLFGSAHETDMPGIFEIELPEGGSGDCSLTLRPILSEMLNDLEGLAFDVCTDVEPQGSCDDGKPKALVFRYTGESCTGSSRQDGSFSCSGNPMGAEPIRVVVTADTNEHTATPGTETVSPGQTVRIEATGDKLKSSTKLDIRQGLTTLQSLNIHTSCSKPLAVGDRFGSLVLEQFIPED